MGSVASPRFGPKLSTENRKRGGVYSTSAAPRVLCTRSAAGRDATGDSSSASGHGRRCVPALVGAPRPLLHCLWRRESRARSPKKSWPSSLAHARELRCRLKEQVIEGHPGGCVRARRGPPTAWVAPGSHGRDRGLRLRFTEIVRFDQSAVHTALLERTCPPLPGECPLRLAPTFGRGWLTTSRHSGLPRAEASKVDGREGGISIGCFEFVPLFAPHQGNGP
jgi:hypothetical protein